MRYWSMTAALVVFAATSLLSTPRDGGLARSAAETLASFVGESRWTEARSALPLPYRPWRGETRLDDYRRVLGALSAPELREDPQQPLVLAQQYVWRGGEGNARRAETILAAQPESGLVWNERALLALSLGRPLEALEAANRALGLEPELPAAIFNRALALEQAQAFDQAALAWERLLEVEPYGPWADEARLRWERLERANALVESQAEHLHTDLSRWLYTVGSSKELEEGLARDEIRLLLQRALDVGEELYRTEIEWLRSLDEAGWMLRRRQGARYLDDKARVLAGELPLSQRALPPADGPLLSLRYAALAAYDAIQRNADQKAIVLLREVERLCEAAGCLQGGIFARSDMGTLLQRRGDFHGARRAFESALAALPPDELVGRAELLNKLALLASRTAAPRRAEALFLESARVARKAGAEMVRAVALLNLANEQERRGRATVAEALAREAEGAAERAGVARLAHKAQQTLADALVAQGRLLQAEELLEASWGEARSLGIVEVELGNRLALASVRVAQGRPGAASALLASVREDWERSFLLEAQLRRLDAEAHLLQGEEEAAAERFAALLDEMLGAHRASSVLVQQRILADAADLVSHLALLRARLDGADAAWAVVAPEGRRPLGQDECLVAPILRGQTGALLIATAAGTRYEEVGATPDGIALLDHHRCGPMTRRVTLLDKASTEAAPWAKRLRLQHPEVAQVLAGDALASWPDGRVEGRALVVHSPRPVATDRGLAFLYGAAREAELIRTFLGEVTELSEERATPAAVREESARHGLLHFAVHGDALLQTGAASYLVLAGEDGLLEVSDALEFDLEGQPLVVLSACRSGGRSADRESDGAGLTWAFLEAGARAVIAHQDVLRDDVALSFAEAFYPVLGQGLGVSAAFESAVAAVREQHGVGAAAGFILSI